MQLPYFLLGSMLLLPSCFISGAEYAKCMQDIRNEGVLAVFKNDPTLEACTLHEQTHRKVMEQIKKTGAIARFKEDLRQDAVESLNNLMNEKQEKFFQDDLTEQAQQLYQHCAAKDANRRQAIIRHQTRRALLKKAQAEHACPPEQQCLRILNPSKKSLLFLANVEECTIPEDANTPLSEAERTRAPLRYERQKN